ncbi:hypothetical protein LINPERPRIM_LOCUS13029 [Linum perenne]
MSFRGLLAFNLAMLGKKGWEFLSNPNALVSHVYEAKDILKGNFLTAAKGASPNFIWKSVHATQELVQRRYRWRLGNGHAARV